MKAIGANLAERDLARLVRFIDGYRRRRGYAPTVREIQTALDLSSTSVAQYWVVGACRRKLLKKDGDSARSIRVTAAGRKLAKEGPQTRAAYTVRISVGPLPWSVDRGAELVVQAKTKQMAEIIAAAVEREMP